MMNKEIWEDVLVTARPRERLIMGFWYNEWVLETDGQEPIENFYRWLDARLEAAEKEDCCF